ncbi:hypothetical protein SAMD00023353_0902270 [Rosellinia necatrix]|uniref:Myb-like domain-containing protein n=1 Tax=Rosellinia necatrix TaxID=77044 RepID=A0A1W2TLF8_ROSNE|nr:hypothetical protein SAMD00023353_0902270 [Rosellinia necatrix]
MVEVTFNSPVITDATPLLGNLSANDNCDNYDSGIDSTRAEAGSDYDTNKLRFVPGVNQVTKDAPGTITVKAGKDIVKAIEQRNKREQQKMPHSSDGDSSDATPEWTKAQDRIICVRKFEGKAWADIGKEVSRGRRECQLRHRELVTHAKELGLTAKKLAKVYIDDDEKKKDEKKEEGEAAKPKKGKSKNDVKGEKQDKPKPKPKPKPKTKAKSKPVTEAQSEDSEPEEPQSKGDAAGGKPKKSAKAKGKQKAKVKQLTPESSPGGESSSSFEADREEAEEAAAAAKYWEGRCYVYDALHTHLYPDQKALRPDLFYSERDCRVLAGLEARYRANKWLSIQADFCNATGRMVHANILQTKFEQG